MTARHKKTTISLTTAVIQERSRTYLGAHAATNHVEFSSLVQLALHLVDSAIMRKKKITSSEEDSEAQNC